MEQFWSFLKILAIVSGALIALFLVLISLPESKLGKAFLKGFGILNIVIAIMLGVYVVSPIDYIPDVIPVAGQSDDAAALVGLVIDGLIAYVSLKKSKTENIKVADKQIQ